MIAQCVENFQNSQIYALSCEVLAQHIDKEELNTLKHISYSDIFSNHQHVLEDNQYKK